MTARTHTKYDTVGHMHVDSLIQSVEPLWLIVVECRDGRRFLEAEFQDDEFLEFSDVYLESRGTEPVFYPDQPAVLMRALQIAKRLRPAANTTKLEDLIKAPPSS